MKHTTTNHQAHVHIMLKKNWERIAQDRHEIIEILRQRSRWQLWTFSAAVVVAAFVGYLIGKEMR